MNFINLEYFVAAAEEMNFTQAALRLHISQQALSKHIAKLEGFYGIELFDRGPPMTLTSAGRSLYKSACGILTLKKETELKLQDIKDFRNGDLTVGVSYHRGNVMLPPILKEMRRKFPRVRFRLSENPLSKVIEELYQGKVDLMIGYVSEDTRLVSSVPLYKEHCLIAVPEPFFDEFFTPLQRRELLEKPEVKMDHFKDCPFIGMPPHTWMGRIVDDYCRETGIRLNIVMELQNIRTLVDLCLEGIGVTVCPGIYFNRFLMEGREKPRFFRWDRAETHKEIAVNFLKSKYQSRIAKEFVATARQIFGS